MAKILQTYGNVLLAAGFALAATIEILGRSAPHGAALLTLGALVAVSLVWRVRAPLRVLALNLAGSLAIELITGPDDYPVTLGLVLLVSVYSAAANTVDRDETAAGALVVASVPILTGAHALDYEWPDPGATTNVFIGFIFLTITFRGAWLAGKWMQQKRAKQRALVAERAEQAEKLCARSEPASRANCTTFSRTPSASSSCRRVARGMRWPSGQRKPAARSTRSSALHPLHSGRCGGS